MNLKSIILAIIILGLGLVFSLVTKSVFELQLVWWKTMLYPSLVLIPFLACEGLFLYLVKNRWLNYLLGLIIAIIILIIMGWKTGLAITSLILAFSIAISHWQIQSDIKSRIKIVLDKSLLVGLKTVYFGLSLMIVAIFFYTPWAHFYDEGIKIPVQYQMAIFSQVIPGIEANATVDETILALFWKDQGKEFTEIKEEIKNISPNQLTELRQQSREKLGLTSLNLQGNEAINQHPEIVNVLLEKNIGSSWQKIAYYLPYILAIIVFEIIAILGYLLIPLALSVSYVLYLSMRAIGWIKLEKFPTEKEIIEF